MLTALTEADLIPDTHAIDASALACEGVIYLPTDSQEGSA
jgi:hypothetical protein